MLSSSGYSTLASVASVDPFVSNLSACLRSVFPLLKKRRTAPRQALNLRQHAVNTRIHLVFPAVFLAPLAASLPHLLESAPVPIQFRIFFMLTGNRHVYDIDGLSVHLSYCIPSIVQWDVVLVTRLMNLALILWLCFVGFGNMRKGHMTSYVEVVVGLAR